MQESVFFAHTLEGKPTEEWQPLSAHLNETARLAEAFAEKFGSKEWGRLIGLWHDLGKYSPAFQQKLLDTIDNPKKYTRVNHSSAGAQLAKKLFRQAWLPIAFAIAGHHAGLANQQDLRGRLESEPDFAAKIADRIPADIKDSPAPVLPQFLVARQQGENKRQYARRIEFWIRMLYSCLVDADYLNTEAFMSRDRAKERETQRPKIPDLLKKLEKHIDAKTTAALTTPVNAKRAEVLEACRKKASLPPGAFSLTVPTGGGKTLSSMNFALRHALKHGLERVIVVIPYTSIIEQNAKVYCEAFGPDAIIEHHSNRDTINKNDGDWKNGEPLDTDPHELACENWDAPIIVTTSAQFFDSLFSNRSSSCRKLHNIANSVVIFDEVQTFPPGLRMPILEVLQELIDHYRVSAVFCTATQPALRAEDNENGLGIRDIREIVEDPRELFSALKRVEVRWPEDISIPSPLEEIARRAQEHPQVLVVVHKRDDARKLAELMGGDTIHLSALMCPAHRTKVFKKIREQLKANQTCRVVSTQLVEAGVDLDFPVVMRALAGLDSLAQAAGRCNREGRSKRGLFEIFVAESSPPPGVLRTAFGATKTLFNLGEIDLNDPAIFTDFFARLYGDIAPDGRGIQAPRTDWKFAETAKNFSFIPDSGVSVIIPYDAEAQERLQKYRDAFGFDKRAARRALQRYSVNIYSQRQRDLEIAGVISPLFDGASVYVLNDSHKKQYDEFYGLRTTGDKSADPASITV